MIDTAKIAQYEMILLIVFRNNYDITNEIGTWLHTELCGEGLILELPYTYEVFDA